MKFLLLPSEVEAGVLRGTALVLELVVVDLVGRITFRLHLVALIPLLWGLEVILELMVAPAVTATSSAQTQFAEEAGSAQWPTAPLTALAGHSSETAEAPEVLVAVGALTILPAVVEVLVDIRVLEDAVVVDLEVKTVAEAVEVVVVTLVPLTQLVLVVV
jgi:hypothetical protein